MGCGSSSAGSGQSGNGPGSSHSAYKVSVTTASFPPKQVLAGNVHLVISVRNAGTGMGILRRTLRDYLKRHPHVVSVTEPPYNEGGQGATLVELKP